MYLIGCDMNDIVLYISKKVLILISKMSPYFNRRIRAMENDPCFKEPYSAEAQVCSQRNTPSSAPYSFTYDNLFKCLYMRNEVRDSRTVENCEKALQKGNKDCCFCLFSQNNVANQIGV